MTDRTSRQATDTRTQESHPGTPTPRGDMTATIHPRMPPTLDRTMIVPSSSMYNISNTLVVFGDVIGFF